MSILDRVKESEISAKMPTVEANQPRGSSDRRQFWINQWTALNNRQSLTDNKDCRFKANEDMKKGKSPIEIWDDFVEDMDSKGKADVWLIKTDEMKDKWKEAKANGTTEDFWFEYWDQVSPSMPHMIKRHWNPRDIQNEWKTLRDEGVPPEEIWERMGQRHPMCNRRRWGHFRRDRDSESATCAQYRHRPCRFFNRKHHDESTLFNEFDFN